MTSVRICITSIFAKLEDRATDPANLLVKLTVIKLAILLFWRNESMIGIILYILSNLLTEK